MEDKAYSLISAIPEFHCKDSVTAVEPFNVRYHVEFSVQRPNNDSPTERAIFVHLQGSSEDYKWEINVTTRVIFDFGEEPISIDDESFMKQYGEKASVESREKINAVLSAMGVGWTISEIPCP